MASSVGDLPPANTDGDARLLSCHCTVPRGRHCLAGRDTLLRHAAARCPLVTSRVPYPRLRIKRKKKRIVAENLLSGRVGANSGCVVSGTAPISVRQLAGATGAAAWHPRWVYLVVRQKP